MENSEGKSSPYPREEGQRDDSNDVICEGVEGGLCNICGGKFEEGDDICGLGQHKIGEKYPKI